MEFISTSMLKKYEDIINEINKEHEKSLQLKRQLEQENNNLIIRNLIKSGLIQKLAQLSVKIFNDITEVFTLYDGELLQNITEYTKHEFHKFYLVELYITDELLSKLSKEDWFINISIQSDTFFIGQSLNLTRRKIFEVIPVPEDIVDCVVEAYLICTKNKWLPVKLDTVQVDISYHFFKYKKKQRFSYIDDILQLTKLYNKDTDIFLLKELPQLSYQLTFPALDKHKFIELLIQNSYHNLDIELFAELQSDNRKDFIIQIGASFNKIEITYNRKDSINIKANITDMKKIKKYFLTALCDKTNKCSSNISGLTELQNTLVSSLQEAVVLYNKTRKLSSCLPV